MLQLIKEKLQNSSTIYNYKRILPFVKPYCLRACMALGLAIPIGCLDAVIALSLKPYMDVVMIEKNAQPDWYIPILIVAFIHSDSDLYSSTKTTLECLKDHVQCGTVIVFDELLNYPGWEDNEYKALMEFLNELDIKLNI